MYKTIYLICETITIMIPHISHLKIQTEAKIKVYRVEIYDRYTTSFLYLILSILNLSSCQIWQMVNDYHLANFQPCFLSFARKNFSCVD